MKELTAAQRKLIELDNQYAEYKKMLEERKVVTAQVKEEIGVGGYFQDPETGCVYKIVEPEGHWVSYDKLSYVRTRKEGETRGELSIKEANEAGYDLESRIQQ
jgi:hypothetical protein